MSMTVILLKAIKILVIKNKFGMAYSFNHLKNPFPNEPWFLPVFNTNLLKHCGKRRNCS